MLGIFRKSARIQASVATFSECGPVRSENQDHLFASRQDLVFCVADGMGGGEGGGVASEIVCREVSRSIVKRADFKERVRLVDEAVKTADGEVRAFAAKARFSQMGTTATVLVVDPCGIHGAAVGNVGDSRAYRMRDGELSLLTRDHTLENEFLGRGVAQDSLTGRRLSHLAHILTRAVGVGGEAGLEWRKVDVRAGDVFLLCSDGVYGYVPPSDFRSAVAQGGDASEISERVRQLVLAGGAYDNLSAVVVKIG